MKFPTNQETPEALWQILSDARLVQGDRPADPVKAHGDDLPWLAKGMLGMAAWFSSLLFLVFVALLFGGTFENPWVRAVLGIIAFAAASMYFYKARSSVFVAQIFFILALSGQVLVASSILPSERHLNSITSWLLVALLEIMATVAIAYQPSRFASALTALIALSAACYLSTNFSGLFLPLCLAALAAVLHVQWQSVKLWPVAALALSMAPLVDSVTTYFFGTKILYGRIADPYLITMPFWMWKAVLIAVWLGVAGLLMKRVTGALFSPENAGVWLLALLLAAGTWPVPMALFALAVFFLGFSQRDKLLEGIGIAQLLWLVGRYYYALEDTLLFKSLTLSALGAALLLLYAASRYLLPQARHGEKA